MTDRIFHIATRADWEQTLRTGTYTTSTVGRTLADEGYIHASRRDQVSQVYERYYGRLGKPLVLLTIDPARLRDAEVRVDPVGDDTYPHIYGPINRSAVVAAVPLDRHGHPESMGVVMLKGMARRMGVAVLVMMLIAMALLVGAALGR